MTLSRNNPELLGTEPVGRLLKRYALPAIIAMSSSSLYNIIDSIFIGHGVGAMAISGLAIAMPLMNLMAAFGSLVGVGASSLISIRLGQGNKQRAFLILSNAIMLNVVIGLTFTTLGLIFLDDILYFFGASDQTIPYARDFMRIILSGNVITHVFMGMNEILRASGYPKKAMGIMLTAVFIIVCLNPLFIFGFGWGVRGSAFATITGQCVALVLEFTHFLNRKHFLYLKRGTFRFIGTIVRKVLSIGMAPFLLNVCASIVVIFINNALKKTGGDISIGAYGIVNRVLMLFVMIVNGLNQGMQPIVGYNYGARQFDRVIRTLKLNIVCAVCVTTFGFILGHFFPPPRGRYVHRRPHAAERSRNGTEDIAPRIPDSRIPNRLLRFLPIHRQTAEGHPAVAHAPAPVPRTAAGRPARPLRHHGRMGEHAHRRLPRGIPRRGAPLFPDTQDAQASGRNQGHLTFSAPLRYK